MAAAASGSVSGGRRPGSAWMDREPSDRNSTAEKRSYLFAVNLHKESLKYFSNYSAVRRNPYSNSENVNLAGLSKMRFPIITELPLNLNCL